MKLLKIRRTDGVEDEARKLMETFDAISKKGVPYLADINRLLNKTDMQNLDYEKGRSLKEMQAHFREFRNAADRLANDFWNIMLFAWPKK